MQRMMSNAKEKPRTQFPSAAFHDQCKMERKECLENCTILYRFVSNDLHKFSILHQVFGACNVIKLIQDLPSDQKIDAVNSMVFEASARLQDPVFGCVGRIQRLQLQISDLESQISATQATIEKIRYLQSIRQVSNGKVNPTISTSLNDDDGDDGEDEDLFDSDLTD